MSHECHNSPESLRRLEWEDEAEALEGPADSPRLLERAFWAKLFPAIFNTRCVDYQQPQLDWD